MALPCTTRRRQISVVLDLSPVSVIPRGSGRSDVGESHENGRPLFQREVAAGVTRNFLSRMERGAERNHENLLPSLLTPSQSSATLKE
ncbi:hypothetical protein BaRGS_00035809 [Batillaria attramentaria]|uniref:Uncharacterized protein n=1 Tax=Batillaria attramentaria TaxID=370345 RepID=A0ABD0JDH8_9CAEN